MDTQDFENYVRACHAQDAGDFKKNSQVILLDAPSELPYWTSKGQAGNFKWRSLTTLYNPANHTMTPKKERVNSFFLQMTSLSGLHMMSYATHSMENDDEFRHLVENGDTLIANSDQFFNDSCAFERDRAIGMREYLRQNITLNDNDCFELQSNNMHILHSNVKDANIIIPLPVIINGRLELFTQMADALCKVGAKSVYGLFLCFAVPSHPGEVFNQYPNIPEIRGLSFSEMIGMFGD